MSNRIQFRRDTDSNWVTANPILTEGELGFEINTGFIKIGDGIKSWNQLPYVIGNSGQLPNVLLPHMGNPGPSPIDTLRLYSQKVSGRMMPKFIGPSGLDTSLQPMLARNKVGYWNPPGGANTVPGVFGFTAYTAVGTATARVNSALNLFLRMKRLGYVSTATAGALASIRVPVAQVTLGDGTYGGFHKIIRFGISDANLVAGARTWMGVSSSTSAPTNVDLATLKNCFGMGHMDTDTNWKIYFGGNISQPPIDLGPDFPCNTTNVDVYELGIFCPPEDSKLYWEVIRLNTGHVASGMIDGTVDASNTLPATNLMLSHSVGWRTNNTTALAVGLDIMSDYIETDY